MKMVFVRKFGKHYYLCYRHGNQKRGYINKEHKIYSSYLIKPTHNTYSEGAYLKVGNFYITFPKELIGKRVRLRVEIEEEEDKDTKINDKEVQEFIDKILPDDFKTRLEFAKSKERQKLQLYKQRYRKTKTKGKKKE